MIRGEMIERADRRLAVASETGLGANPKERQFRYSRVDRPDYERYLKHHRTTLHGMMAKAGEDDQGVQNLTPPQEAVVLTMMTHFFLAGVNAAREDER